jgi:hypothetical protein
MEKEKDGQNIRQSPKQAGFIKKAINGIKKLDRTAFVCYNLFCLLSGEVSERFKELVLKTSDASSTVSSNLTLSAIACFCFEVKRTQFNIESIRIWRNTQEVEEAPLLRV